MGLVRQAVGVHGHPLPLLPDKRSTALLQSLSPVYSKPCTIYFGQVSSTTADALRHLHIGILYRIEYAKNPVNILGDRLRVWDIPVADHQRWRRSYAILLWRAVAMHSTNLTN